MNESKLKIGGYFDVICRDGASGILKWKDRAKNIVTNEGLDHILDVVLHGDSQVSPWYIGLVDSDSTFAAADTMASHAGWTENEVYTGDRKEFVEAAASSQSLSNTGSASVFTISSGTQSIEGAFLTSTTSGTGGTLFCEAAFASAKSVDSGDTLEVTYTINAADDGA
jgi:hypothetical protein